MSSDRDAVELDHDPWSIIDLIWIGGSVAAPLVFGPIVLFAAGQRQTAAMVAAASWLIVCFYESPLETKLKHEVSRRVG